MSCKTILAHCDANPTVAQRLTFAAKLAKRHDAYLIGLHIQEPFEAPPMLAGMPATGSLLTLFEETAKANLTAAQLAFAEAVKGTGLKTEWRAEDGYMDRLLAVHALYADLVVLGKVDPKAPSFAPLDLPETIALSSGRPTLIVPKVGTPAGSAKTVMLCWNASRESARAASDALQLMRAATRVIVLCVDPRSSNYGHGAEPRADAAAWLARHGLDVAVQCEIATDSDVGNVILFRAAGLSVDLVVMGLFGHSRLREMILGGTSRTLIDNMAPVTRTDPTFRTRMRSQASVTVEASSIMIGSRCRVTLENLRIMPSACRSTGPYCLLSDATNLTRIKLARTTRRG